MIGIKPRFVHWRLVLAPTWRLVFALPTTLLSTAVLYRDEFLSPEVAAKYRLLTLLPAWPWYWWAIGTLIIVMGLVLEGSFRLSRLASDAPGATTRTLEAHTEELRLARLAREKENDPIERTLRAALDPSRRFGGETLTTVAETTSAADRPALQIIGGTGAEYEDTKAVSLYRSQRTFSIALQNSSRIMFVSNCKLYLDIINPKTGSPARYLIQDSFTLNPTESRLVEIVHYAEPTGSTRGDTDKDRIVLHLPHPTGWGSRDMWPWLLPLGAYVITLMALSRESEPCEAVFKIWVDESYKLHFGRA